MPLKRFSVTSVTSVTFTRKRLILKAFICNAFGILDLKALLALQLFSSNAAKFPLYFIHYEVNPVSTVCIATLFVASYSSVQLACLSLPKDKRISYVHVFKGETGVCDTTCPFNTARRSIQAFFNPIPHALLPSPASRPSSSWLPTL